MVMLRVISFLLFLNGLVFSSPVLSDFQKIESFEEAQNIIKNLRSQGVQSEDIAVILDFHGVMCEEEAHLPPLRPKQGAREFLSYLKEEEGIPFVCATAWDDFNQVVEEGIVALELSELFEVNPAQETLLETVFLGKKQSVSLKSYHNGKFAALKEIKDELDPSQKEPWFRQKIFALEKIYPQKKFKYILAIDDGKNNLDIMQNDFPKTIYSKDKHFKELILLYLQKPRPAPQPASKKRTRDDDTIKKETAPVKRKKKKTKLK